MTIDGILTFVSRCNMVTSGDVFSQTTIPFLNLSATPLPLSPDNAFLQDSFDIVDVQERGTSTLFFTKARDTGEHIVIKKLSQYKDTRYDLETVEKRNKCLREALKFNSRFTSGIFIGVARIREINTDQIVIDEIKADPDEELDPEFDHALLMRKLPENRWLDR